MFVLRHQYASGLLQVPPSRRVEAHVPAPIASKSRPTGLIRFTKNSAILIIPFLLALALGSSSFSEASVQGRVSTPVVRHVLVSSTCSQVQHSCVQSDSEKPLRHHSATAIGAHPGPVVLRVQVGYGDHYRRSAWVPVRITLTNRAQATMQGTVLVRGSAPEDSSLAQSPPALYQMPVVLPVSATKQVTLYLPGQYIGSVVNVRFLGGHGTVSASDSPTTFDDQEITVGAFTDDAAATMWLRTVHPLSGSITMVTLRAATVDPVPQALASFDTILLSNADTSRLDSSQFTSLRRYVENGGSLLLIGGPTWQETLRPLPSGLVPGILRGSRILPDLSGLSVSLHTKRKQQSTFVSVLSEVHGTLLASQSGVPLVVRERVGRGRIIYVAFDPSVNPIPNWPAATAFLRDLVMQAAPELAHRVSANSVGGAAAQDGLAPALMHPELVNLPVAPSRLLSLLVLLAVACSLLIGLLPIFLLTRFGRTEVILITVPALTAMCVGANFGLADRFSGTATVLNTVAVVDLGKTSGEQPVTLYTALLAPVRGDYHLVWRGWALPQVLPVTRLSRSSSRSTSSSVLHFEEGNWTHIDSFAMDGLSTRSVALYSTISLPGTVSGNLQLTAGGDIVGTVRNQTGLPLIQPVVIDGKAVTRLADLAPGESRYVRLLPSAGPTGRLPLWAQRSGVNDLYDVAKRLPEASTMSGGMDLTLLGWSTAHLGTFTVNGVAPERHDLNLLVAPLSVHFPKGSSHFRAGTLIAHLIDAHVMPTRASCCFDRSAPGLLALGPGSSATFQFDLPNSGPVVVHRLTLTVNVSGAQQRDIGDTFKITRIYNWRSRSWRPLLLHSGVAVLRNADRFLSPAGTFLLQLRATTVSGDVIVNDPQRDIQLSGWVTLL